MHSSPTMPSEPKSLPPPRTGEDAWVRQTVRSFQQHEQREAAYQRLFQTYFPAVRRFFARKGLGAEDCLDLTQETFLRIYKGLGDFRGDSRFDTWLYRVARTTHLKHLRHRKAGKRDGEEVSADGLEEGGGSPFIDRPRQLRRVLSEERRRALMTAIQGLPDQGRRCLLLYVERDLKYREIATVMNLSIETVKVHLFRARKRLRETLGDDFMEELDA